MRPFTVARAVPFKVNLSSDLCHSFSVNLSSDLCGRPSLPGLKTSAESDHSGGSAAASSDLGLALDPVPAEQLSARPGGGADSELPTRSGPSSRPAWRGG